MVIQGTALAKAIVFPCLPGVSVPPSPKAHRVRAGAGAALGCSLNQTCPCAGKAPTQGGIQWLGQGQRLHSQIWAASEKKESLCC